MDSQARPLRDIGERLLDFGADVIRVLREFPPSLVARRIEDQLVRSATSAGANYEEARATHTRADFCNKPQISLKEMREARYWLCLAKRAELIHPDIGNRLVAEATELRAILSKAVATARSNTKPQT